MPVVRLAFPGLTLEWRASPALRRGLLRRVRQQRLVRGGGPRARLRSERQASTRSTIPHSRTHARGRFGDGLLLARRLAEVEVHASSVEDASLPEREFDVVCGWHVLEHIANPLSTLQRLRRAIAPAGVALFEVPNFQSVRGQRERLAWRLLQPTHHVAQYGPRSLAQLLARAGFDDVEVETVPWAVYRRWPRSVASHLKQAVVLRSWPAGSHPAKHELLRAVARVRP